MKKALISATSILALCAFSTVSFAGPTTGDANRPTPGDKGPNGEYASGPEGKASMGTHASGGKNNRP